MQAEIFVIKKKLSSKKSKLSKVKLRKSPKIAKIEPEQSKSKTKIVKICPKTTLSCSSERSNNSTVSHKIESSGNSILLLSVKFFHRQTKIKEGIAFFLKYHLSSSLSKVCTASQSSMYKVPQSNHLCVS